MKSLIYSRFVLMTCYSFTILTLLLLLFQAPSVKLTIITFLISVGIGVLIVMLVKNLAKDVRG